MRRIYMVLPVFFIANGAAAAMLAKDNIEKTDLVFERHIGEQSKSPVVTSCKIYSGTGKDFESAHKIFLAIKTKPLAESMHIVAKDPSVTYKAVLGSDTTLIYSDYETLKYIQAPETKSLTTLIDTMCSK